MPTAGNRRTSRLPSWDFGGPEDNDRISEAKKVNLEPLPCQQPEINLNLPKPFQPTGGLSLIHI